MQLLFVFVLFRLIPGGNLWTAAFGTFLYGLHPVTAETVNYPLDRREVATTDADRAQATPWNTYVAEGLPATPMTGMSRWPRPTIACRAGKIFL